MRKILGRVLHFIDQFLFPSYCQRCRVFLEDFSPFCVDCYVGIKRPLTRDVLLSNGKILTVYSAAEYTGVVRSLICGKHYQNVAFARLLGPLIFDLCSCPWQEFDFLLPVPLHWTRQWRRGFNQSYIIAQVLAERTSCLIAQPLIRRKKTMYQAELSASERRVNVDGAFCFRRPDLVAQYKDKSIVLVDDVFTTGATVEAIAKILYKAGARRVVVVTAARSFYS